ncbi:sigma 54-interacting transcriptional regulator [Thermocrinis sp.]|uniref:sigma 54-interacting transcriptional regulator n=1 Tax=Thermocrinis sp. TaxID=2024383 RepID=UPI002FDD49C1
MGFETFENLFEGVLVIDKNLRIVYANPSAKRLLGRDLKAGEDCRGLFSICDSCPARLVLEEGEGVQVYDVEIWNKRHACWSMSLLNDGYLVETFRDVTNVVHCIVEAERQRSYKEAILNSIVEAILVVDKDGFVLEHNNIAHRMLCRDEEENLVGKNLRELIELSVEELPPEGERADVYIQTPCGRQKASVLVSPMNSGFGYVVSLYAIQEVLSCSFGEENTLVFKSPSFQKVLELAQSVAEYPTNVLIEGETGTGKSLLAKYIHYISPRRDKPFVKVNCAAIPEGLLEAELFGYVKGAFTGALKDKPGKVELADGGTLLLDEIGDMPLSLQAKILHLAQEKEFERLGDTKTRKVDVRIIASTNKNLRELVQRGLFREDLYYRLSVIKIHIPPLRERVEDIPILVNHFIQKFSRAYNRKIKGISSDAMKALLSYPFHGNIRELENIIERAVITAKGTLINLEDLQLDVRKGQDFEEEIERIKKVLEQVGGNKTLAAKILGMHRTTLWRKMKELGFRL